MGTLSNSFLIGGGTENKVPAAFCCLERKEGTGGG